MLELSLMLAGSCLSSSSVTALLPSLPTTLKNKSACDPKASPVSLIEIFSLFLPLKEYQSLSPRLSILPQTRQGAVIFCALAIVSFSSFSSTTGTSETVASTALEDPDAFFNLASKALFQSIWGEILVVYLE